jgi:molybdopterin synthase catalytic subunit
MSLPVAVTVPVDIAIIEHAFSQTDLDQRVAALGLTVGEAGAIVSFVGQVRRHGDQTNVTGLILEHYPAMTQPILAQHVLSACQRWPLLGVVLVHRVGHMQLGENIVAVVVASPHRQAAFDAVQYLMDFLKNEAPFWKQEVTPHGAAWVEQKQADLEQAKRW